jgi:hypothetical protein
MDWYETEQDGLLDLFRLNQQCLVAHLGSRIAQRVWRAYSPVGAREVFFGRDERRGASGHGFEDLGEICETPLSSVAEHR